MRLVLLGMLVVPTLAWSQARLPKGEEEVNRASEKLVRGDYAGAEPLLRRAVADAPDDPYAHFNLASVLRDTGRNQEAVAEYQRARELFESVGPRANGEGDIGNCLYGIALAEDALGDTRAAARAWSDYLAFAQRFSAEQPAVAIARERVRNLEGVARTPRPAAPEATRPSTVQ